MSDGIMTTRIDRWDQPTIPNIEQLRRRLIAEGYSVFQWSDAPGTTYADHSHPDDQSHWILSGALELHAGGETYTLRAGDRDFLPANTVHSAFVPGHEPVVYLIGAKSCH